MFRSFLRGHPSLSKTVRRLKLVAAPQENSSSTSGLYGLFDFDNASYIEVFLFRNVVSLIPLLKELELVDVLIIQSDEFLAFLRWPITVPQTTIGPLRVPRAAPWRHHRTFERT